jgi:hypothetical protein
MQLPVIWFVFKNNMPLLYREMLYREMLYRELTDWELKN